MLINERVAVLLWVVFERAVEHIAQVGDVAFDGPHAGGQRPIVKLGGVALGVWVASGFKPLDEADNSIELAALGLQDDISQVVVSGLVSEVERLSSHTKKHAGAGHIVARACQQDKNTG